MPMACARPIAGSTATTAAALPLLRAYAASWPQAGLEFRKQYVVIRTGSPG